MSVPGNVAGLVIVAVAMWNEVLVTVTKVRVVHSGRPSRKSQRIARTSQLTEVSINCCLQALTFNLR